MGMIADLVARMRGRRGAGDTQVTPEERATAGGAADTTFRGASPTPENQVDRIYRLMWVDPAHRQTVLDIREMDLLDPRVKTVHRRVARDAVKNGLRLELVTPNSRIERLWAEFERRLDLRNPQKLKSDARGLVMEGNLPVQWVLDQAARVVAAVRMPSETIVPQVDERGLFKDPGAAYKQVDGTTGQVRATFPLWALSMARLDPVNWDDRGALGRPFLDANRGVWRKLGMTEEDLVIRRKTRAPQRLFHVVEGATDEQLDAYEKRHYEKQERVSTDFFMSKKGSVGGIQGDANLDQIGDVAYLLDTFFAGGPGPKGLFGYPGDLSRDVLEDLKRVYYEEVDDLQDTLAAVYQAGFELELLLAGLDPAVRPFKVKFMERQTETPTQRTDRALKQQVLGFSQQTVIETAGGDPEREKKRREQERRSGDPYPNPMNVDPAGRATTNITPSNARKGESATTVSTRSS